MNKWWGPLNKPGPTTTPAICNSVAAALSQLCTSRCYATPEWHAQLCSLWHKFGECKDTGTKMPKACSKGDENQLERLTSGCTGPEHRWPPPRRSSGVPVVSVDLVL